MRFWYLSHRRPAKTLARLCICAVSPEASLVTHIKYGSRRRNQPKIRHLAPTGWQHMHVWRMSVGRMKSVIISWAGSNFFQILHYHHNCLLCTKLSCFMTKLTKRHVRPAKTQISLGIHPVWSESSLCTQWVAKDPSFLHADSKNSDETGRMPRLIWIFAGRTCHFVGFVLRQLNFE